MTKKGPTPKRRDARRSRIVESETGFGIVTSSDIQYSVHDKMGQWVEPGPGEHHWMVVAVFNVSTEKAAAAYVGVEQVALDMENLATLNTGCMKCGEVFTLDLSKRPCSEVLPEDA